MWFAAQTETKVPRLPTMATTTITSKTTLRCTISRRMEIRIRRRIEWSSWFWIASASMTTKTTWRKAWITRGFNRIRIREKSSRTKSTRHRSTSSWTMTISISEVKASQIVGGTWSAQKTFLKMHSWISLRLKQRSMSSRIPKMKESSMKVMLMHSWKVAIIASVTPHLPIHRLDPRLLNPRILPLDR